MRRAKLPDRLPEVCCSALETSKQVFVVRRHAVPLARAEPIGSRRWLVSTVPSQHHAYAFPTGELIGTRLQRRVLPYLAAMEFAKNEAV